LNAHGPAAALEVLDSMRSSDAIVLNTAHLIRTIALVQLDRLYEARMEVRKLHENDPTWTLVKHRRRFFYMDSDALESSLHALRIAGLPEN
jgi:hypothetical protein